MLSPSTTIVGFDCGALLPAGFAAAFSGSHRFVLDYLADEALDDQPAQLRVFLLETSVLDRLSGELCDAVTGRAGSQAMLEHIERAGLFLVPLDEVRGWWRYHHLFADLLRARLQAEQPGRAVALHRPRRVTWEIGARDAPDAIRTLHKAARKLDVSYAIGGVAGASLTGSAGNNVTLGNTNKIGALTGFNDAGFRFALNNTGALNAAGAINAGTVAIADSGTLTVSGTVSATAVSLTAGSINIPGLVNGGSIALTGTTGAVAETGSRSACPCRTAPPSRAGRRAASARRASGPPCPRR